MKFRLLSMSERKRKECYFCGEKRSVKYLVSIRDGSRIIDVASCNKCVFTNAWRLLEVKSDANE